MINVWENYRQALLSHNADSLKPCSSKACPLASKLLSQTGVKAWVCLPPTWYVTRRASASLSSFAVWTEPELSALG